MKITRKDRQENQQKILNHATQMLVENPFAKLNIYELGRRTGTVRATIYNCYGSLPTEVIPRKIIEKFSEMLSEQLLGAVINPARSGIMEQFMTTLRTILYVFDQCPIEGQVVLLRSSPPQDKYEVFTSTSRILSGFLETMLKENLISEDFLHLTSSELASIMLSIILASQKRYRFDTPPWDMKKSEADLLRILKVFFRPEKSECIQETIEALAMPQ